MSIKRGYQMLKSAVADFSRDDAMSLAAPVFFFCCPTRYSMNPRNACRMPKFTAVDFVDDNAMTPGGNAGGGWVRR